MCSIGIVTAGISHDLLRNMYGYSLPNHTDYRLEPSQDSQVVGAEYVQCYDYKPVTVPIAWEVLYLYISWLLSAVYALCAALFVQFSDQRKDRTVCLHICVPSLSWLIDAASQGNEKLNY